MIIANITHVSALLKGCRRPCAAEDPAHLLSRRGLCSRRSPALPSLSFGRSMVAQIFTSARVPMFHARVTCIAREGANDSLTWRSLPFIEGYSGIILLGFRLTGLSVHWLFRWDGAGCVPWSVCYWRGRCWLHSASAAVTGAYGRFEHFKQLVWDAFKERIDELTFETVLYVWLTPLRIGACVLPFHRWVACVWLCCCLCSPSVHPPLPPLPPFLSSPCPFHLCVLSAFCLFGILLQLYAGLPRLKGSAEIACSRGIRDCVALGWFAWVAIMSPLVFRWSQNES